MELTQAILCIIAAFCLGAAIVVFVIWLIFIGIPYIKNKKWEKLENDVVYIVKKNFNRPMTISKEFIKDLVREILNERNNGKHTN